MKEVINCNVKHNTDGVYRMHARLTTPQMESPASLRKSAAAILNGLRCRAKNVVSFWTATLILELRTV